MLLEKCLSSKFFYGPYFTVLDLNAEVQRKFPYSNRPEKTLRI